MSDRLNDSSGSGGARLLDLVIQSAANPLWLVDAQGHIHVANSAAESVITKLATHSPESSPQSLFERLMKHRYTRDQEHGSEFPTLELLLADGGTAQLSLVPFPGEPALLAAFGLPTSCGLVTYRDSAMEGETDPLTGLASRGALERRLSLAQGLPLRPQAFFFADLDHFKQVNDRWGHRVGDELLRVVGRRLRGCFRPQDFVARYGGDEFVAIVEPCGPAEAESIARRMSEALRDSIHTRAGLQLEVTASVGVAVGVGDLDLAHLVDLADSAMYEAKRRGREGHIEILNLVGAEEAGFGERGSGSGVRGAGQRSEE